MTGPTGTPPTSPATKQDTTKSVQGSTGSATGATTDISQPAGVKATGTDQLATASTAPKLTSGSQIETATTFPRATASSQMGMGGVVEPNLPQGSRDSESGQTTSSNTIIIGPDTDREQQDRSGKSEGLADTTSQYSRDVGHRASEIYEQGRQAAGQVWDTAQRAADQIYRQSRRSLTSAQPGLADSPLPAIAIGAAIGVLVGYLIGHAMASAGTTRTRRYNDSDEFADSGHYTGSYPSYRVPSSSSARYTDDEFAETGHYADSNHFTDKE